ncbi:MAG: type II secretory pathway pseudopilin PulG [Planctomycetota bacterium]|jgi:type II secretory pathway pseudopilin PulG
MGVGKRSSWEAQTGELGLHLHYRQAHAKACAVQIEGGRAKRRTTGGFALLELMIALIVLTIGMVSMLQASSRTQSLSRETRDRSAAHNALRSMADRILARSDEIVRLAGDNWASDLVSIYGEDGSVGDRFDVIGLNRIDEDQPVGTITIVVDETLTDFDLGLAVGMPRDLDGDGEATSGNVVDFARKLPVVVEVRWSGFRGERSLSHVIWVTGI